MIRHGVQSRDRICVAVLGRSQEVFCLAAELAEVSARRKVRHDGSFVCRRSAVPGKGVHHQRAALCAVGGGLSPTRGPGGALQRQVQILAENGRSQTLAVP